MAALSLEIHLVVSCTLWLVEGHGVALAEIAHGGAQLTVGAAVLADDDGGQAWVGGVDLYGVLELLVILNSYPLLWKHRTLTTGLPGNALGRHFYFQPSTTISYINNCKKIQYV